ncbi:hypothetical protein [Acanthopleuribacter pedis]|uniref:Uncharacterized protein n=1 Tax=Acanthopleuribacter pedis TaxID=442870 RepID=A0A8J7U819_9BACT|nr:hypothetical protein [Acanthopleuribacter pedis]MBO1322011.1 hypothetical protein [Acanthopleuribacter pedis]
MTQTLHIDVYNDVVLLVDADGDVLDAFNARGRTDHPLTEGVTHYTLRSLITLPGHCAVCGREISERNTACTSSGGFHAFVGLDDHPDLPEQHKARARSLALARLHYEDLDFYVEQDQLFPIAELLPTLHV